MSQSELARRMDRPVQAINEILRGVKAITPDTALQLEAVLGVPGDFWVRLDADYRFNRARLANAKKPRIVSHHTDTNRFSDVARTEARAASTGAFIGKHINLKKSARTKVAATSGGAKGRAPSKIAKRANPGRSRSK
jgi:addiction module HigA family antidote